MKTAIFPGAFDPFTRGHEAVVEEAVEATEEAEGYTGDEICTVCNTCVSEGTVIPVISVEETTVAPTVEPTVVPAEPATEEATMDIIVWILAAAVVVAGGAVIFFLKKKK